MTTETTIETAFSIRADVALAALDQCLAFASTDTSRPILTGISVRATVEGMTFAAADGFRLVTVNVAGEFGDWSAVLDGKSLKAALPAIKAAIKSVPKYATAPNITFTHDGATDRYYIGGHVEAMGTVTLKAANQSISIPCLSGSFPDYGQLIPPCTEVGGGRIAVNGAMVGQCLSMASKYADSGIVRVRIQDDPKKPARMDWRSSEGGEVLWTGVGVVMPMFVTWGDEPID